MTGTLHENRRMFIIIFRSLLFRVRNLADKYVENMQIHILY